MHKLTVSIDVLFDDNVQSYGEAMHIIRQSLAPFPEIEAMGFDDLIVFALHTLGECFLRDMLIGYRGFEVATHPYPGRTLPTVERTINPYGGRSYV